MGLVLAMNICIGMYRGSSKNQKSHNFQLGKVQNSTHFKKSFPLWTQSKVSPLFSFESWTISMDNENLYVTSLVCPLETVSWGKYLLRFELLDTESSRVWPIPTYRYRYWLMGISMGTFQTDTDSWRLIHTDISVCYRFFLNLHRYYLKNQYHTNIPIPIPILGV